MTLPHDDHPMKHYDRTCPACNMPPLPEPFFGQSGFVRLHAPYAPAFAAHQMTDYGKQCREAALDEAAVLAEAAFKPAKDCYEIADEIRGIEVKQLIENLREQYLQHGTNHVQKAADLLEMLIAQRSETIEMTYAQAKTIEGLVVERDALKADADRYHWLIARMQASYDSAEHDVPGGFSVYCSMVSAWRTERIVRAEIKWEDKRDEQLGLSAAIDAALAALGETS